MSNHCLASQRGHFELPVVRFGLVRSHLDLPVGHFELVHGQFGLPVGAHVPMMGIKKQTAVVRGLSASSHMTYVQFHLSFLNQHF